MISNAQRNISKRSRNNYIKKDNFSQSKFQNIESLCNDCPQKIKKLVYDMWCRMSSGNSHPYIGTQKNYKSMTKCHRDFSKHFAAVIDGKNSVIATNDPSRNTWNGKPIGNTTHAEGNAIRKFKRLNKLSCFQRGKKLCKEKG